MRPSIGTNVSNHSILLDIDVPFSRHFLCACNQHSGGQPSSTVEALSFLSKKVLVCWSLSVC